MTFAPKIWHDGHQRRTIFIVRTMVKNAEVLLLDSMSRYKVQTISIAELAEAKDVDFGASQERKMKATIRRIAKKKGTTKKALAAIKEVLS
jgi:hypothetical protein